MIPRERLAYLDRVVPHNVDKIHGECDSEAVSVRRELMIKHRLFILSQINSDVFPQEVFDSRASSCQSILSFTEEIPPQQVQFTTKVIYHFINNPREILKVVMFAHKKHKNIDLFAYSIIPSFFGYFSSREHLILAFPFYYALVIEAPNELSRKFLRAFFCNACTHRYIESLTSDVLAFFCRDIRLKEVRVSSRDRLLKQHAEKLVQSAMKHLSLLPSTHLNILKAMGMNQWNTKVVLHFFVADFIIPMLMMHIRISPFAEHIDILEDVLAIACDLAADIQPMFHAKSIFEVPPAFTDIATPGLSLITTPYDLAAFLKIVDATDVKMPRLLTMLRNPKFVTNQKYLPIWVKIFPKTPHPSDITDAWRSVVFEIEKQEIPEEKSIQFERRYRMVQLLGAKLDMSPMEIMEGNGQNPELSLIKDLQNNQNQDFMDFCVTMGLKHVYSRANSFEHFLVQKFAVSRIKSWHKLVSDCWEVYTTYEAHTMLAKHFSSMSVSEIYNERNFPSHIPCNTPVIEQVYYAMRVSRMMKLVEEGGRQKDFQLLDAKWCAVIQESPTKCLPREIIGSLKQETLVKDILDISTQLTTDQSFPFYKIYFRLMSVMRMLELVGKLCDTGMGLIEFAVSICQSAVFASNVLKISVLLIKDANFARCMSKEDVLLWYKLEEAVANLLKQDETAVKLYNQLQDDLIMLL